MSPRDRIATTTIVMRALRSGLRATGLAVAAAALLAPGVVAQERPAPTHDEVAPGVHVFRTAPYGPVGLDGNSVVVVGDDAVLVFDTNGTPSAAAAVLAGIRALTDAPVRWVVLSHWHWDHWYGTEIYRRAFPDVQVIAHEKTAAMMRGPAIEFNRPGLEQQLPAFIASLERRLAAGEAAGSPPEDLVSLRAMVADSRFFLEQKASADLVLPDVTFRERLELDVGGRRVEVLNFGRAVTPGDALLRLPSEGVVVTGDLVIQPVTFALSVYPTEWIAALERLDALDARILIPGHGPAMRDEEHLHATLGALREVRRLGGAAHARGLEPDAAREEMMPDLHDAMVRVTGGDAEVNRAFEQQLVDWYLHRLWEEFEGPLSDTVIAGIPSR